jgi:hypothetical protein
LQYSASISWDALYKGSIAVNAIQYNACSFLNPSNAKLSWIMIIISFNTSNQLVIIIYVKLYRGSICR